jgi:hypothetical protein
LEAVPWDGFNWEEVVKFAGSRVSPADFSRGLIFVHTMEGSLQAKIGDWIVMGTQGEVWPVDSVIFKRTYEVIDG